MCRRYRMRGCKQIPSAESEYNSPIIDTYILFNFSMWVWDTSNRSTKVLTQRLVVAIHVYVPVLHEWSTTRPIYHSSPTQHSTTYTVNWADVSRCEVLIIAQTAWGQNLITSLHGPSKYIRRHCVLYLDCIYIQYNIIHYFFSPDLLTYRLLFAYRQCVDMCHHRWPHYSTFWS